MILHKLKRHGLHSSGTKKSEKERRVKPARETRRRKGRELRCETCLNPVEFKSGLPRQRKDGRTDGAAGNPAHRFLIVH